MTQSETTRLAQELHDGIAQDLVGLGFALDLILSDSATTLTTRLEIRKVRLSVSELLERTRLEIHDLHQMDGSDLFVHIRRLAESILVDYEVEIDLPENYLAFPEATIFQVQRIVREAFRNIVRHANATIIKISAKIGEDSLQISIDDNGTEVGKVQEESFGLLGATKRAEALQGSLLCKPTSTGFSVILSIPIQENEK